MTQMYRIFYRDNNLGGITKSYTVYKMPYTEAIKRLKLFKERYLNEDNSPKPFPNGKGYYNYVDVRIEPVRE